MVFLQFHAQPADVDIDDIARTPLVIPHLDQELVAVNYLSRVAHEDSEHAHFGRREGDRRVPPHGHFQFSREQLDPPDYDPLLSTDDLMVREVPQNRLHARDQLLVIVWLTEVIVRADVEAVQFRLDRIVGGEKDERDLVSFRAELRRKLEPIRLWQCYIEKEQVWRPLLDHLKGPTRIIDRCDLVALFREDELHQRVGKGVVVHDKNVHHRFLL